MSKSRVEALKSEKGIQTRTTPRQKRQNDSDASVSTRKLTLFRLRSLQKMILDIKTRRGVGYRWFERFGQHRFGWYEHVGAGNFKQVHAIQRDYDDIKQVYDLIKDDAKIDAELLTLLLDLIQKQNEVESIMSRIITIARRHAG